MPRIPAIVGPMLKELLSVAFFIYDKKGDVQNQEERGGQKKGN